MAINIAPPQLGGLAARSGQGSLGLSGNSNLGMQLLQSQQAKQAMAQQAAMKQAEIRSRDEAMLKAGMLKNRELEIQENQNIQQGQYQQGLLGVQQQKIAADQANNQGVMDYRYAQLGQDQQKMAMAGQANQQKQAFEQMKLGIEEMAKKDEKELNEMGAFGLMAQSAMSQAKDPTEANMLRNEILAEAVAKGYVPKEQAKQLSQAPLSMFNRATEMMIFSADKAKDLAAMRKANAPDKQAGKLSFTDANGNTLTYDPLTTANKGVAQKDIMTTQDNLGELTSMINNVPPVFFGPAAAKPEWSTPAREWLAGIPGLEKLDPSADDKSQLKLYSNYNSRIKMLSMQTIKQMSGLQYTDKQLEFMMEILPSIGPGSVKTVFDGKSENLVRYYNKIGQARQKVIDSGVNFNSDPNSEYGQKLLAELRNNAYSDNQLDTSKMSNEELDAAIAAAQRNK